jgi:hypothetical protein
LAGRSGTVKHKRKKKDPVTEKELRTTLKNFNQGFFDGKLNLKHWKIRFGTDRECEYSSACADPLTETILINENIKLFRSYIAICLLHEISHAILMQEGYVGYDDSGGHSIRFYAEIDKLYKAGAYEGLL